ncbi:hypothetical protein PENTCL1PPCAC_26402, partial [Pristionchus entomophagus]
RPIARESPSLVSIMECRTSRTADNADAPRDTLEVPARKWILPSKLFRLKREREWKRRSPQAMESGKQPLLCRRSSSLSKPRRERESS